jgi:ATP-dependent Lon protease
MTDEKDLKELRVPDVVGILPLRGTVLFPQSVVPLAAGRASSVQAIEDAVRGGRLVGAVMQRDAAENAPTRDGLHDIGTLALVHKVLKQPDGSLRLVVQGVSRFRLGEVVQTAPYLRARIEPQAESTSAPDMEAEALARSAVALFQKVVTLTPTLPDELASVTADVAGPGAVADVIASALPSLPLALRQELLATVNVNERLGRLVAALGKEVEVLELGSKIQSEIQSEMSKTQR